MIFYSIPIKVEQLGRKNGFAKVDLLESVQQNVRLLLVSPPARSRFDPFYGCQIHRSQFHVNNRAMEGRKDEDTFKSRIERNVEALIGRFEPRLALREVVVDIRYKVEEQILWRQANAPLKRDHVIQVVVIVRGDIKAEFANGETLKLEDTIPLL